LKFKGDEVKPTGIYKVCFQGYHVANSKSYLNISGEELRKLGEAKVITTSAQGVLEEWMRNHQNTGRKLEGRLVFK